MSETQYPYASLIPDTSIRLFTVEPELSNGSVCCTLRHFDGKEFGDAVSDGKECDGTKCDGEKCHGTICHGKVPPYTALSYVWGDSRHTRQIYLGGCLIGVHETLWEFLHQMQTTQNAKTWFWTDYLCLNQADKTEMSQQVQRMGDIYSEAEEALAWLGRERSPVAIRVENSTPVTNLEHQLKLIEERVRFHRNAVDRFFAELPNWTTIMRYRSSEIHYSDYNLPHPGGTAVSQLGIGQLWVYNAMPDVLSLPYWTRVWIVQEVARARAVKLAFGSVSINFDDFLLAHKCHTYHYLMSRGTRPEPGATIAGSKAAIEARAAVRESCLSMRQVLQWSRLCQASQPIDQIYGLFGLLKAHGAGTFSNLESLTVDYTKDITSVFWEVVFSCRILTVGNETEQYFKDELNQFAESVPLLADSMGCPRAFSPQGLSCYSQTDQKPSLRRMAQLTSRMVHMLQQVGRGLYVLTACDQRTYRWRPTRDSARKSRPKSGSSGCISRFGLEMAALYLEYADFDDVGESGEVHAAFIASKLAETANFTSTEWTCKPVHHHLEADQVVLDENKMRRIEYEISWWRDWSCRPVTCYLQHLPTGPEHPGKHQCSGSSLFLWLSDPGLSFRLDFGPSESTRARLNVTVTGHM